MLTAKPRFPIREMVLYGWMPSFLKVWVYRMMGYRVGKGAQFAFGSVVCGKQVRIGADFSQGFLSMIRGDSIEIGNRVKVGALSMVDTPVFSIGDDSKINEQVFAGGLQFPNSSLRIGRNSQIQQMSFINPAPSITIGDDTSIGGHCLIFGHQSWLSVFEGYPADFRSIVIGNNVGVAWRVFIGAGAKIGDGSMIGTHSVVNRTIPPQCLATGSPAKVVAKAPYFPRQLTDEERVEILDGIVNGLVEFLAGHGFGCVRRGDVVEIRREAGTWIFKRTVTEHVVFCCSPAADSSAMISPETRVYISLVAIPPASRRQLDAQGILWADIANRVRADFSHDTGEEVIQFLRRYGVRFYRGEIEYCELGDKSRCEARE